jgi:hypothetical protein
MNVGLCYESVLPARGGCEHYISDLARRLARDGHGVHLFASRWDPTALPGSTVYHLVPAPTGPRFLRPSRFARSCLDSLRANPVDVSLGFDKTWGQDVLYPQGGLHSASRAHNLLKHSPGLQRVGARLIRVFDPASYSFAWLERRQYLGSDRPVLLAISDLVRLPRAVRIVGAGVARGHRPGAIHRRRPTGPPGPGTPGLGRFRGRGRRPVRRHELPAQGARPVVAIARSRSARTAVPPGCGRRVEVWPL